MEISLKTLALAPAAVLAALLGMPWVLKTFFGVASEQLATYLLLLLLVCGGAYAVLFAPPEKKQGEEPAREPVKKQEAAAPSKKKQKGRKNTATFTPQPTPRKQEQKAVEESTPIRSEMYCASVTVQGDLE